jgi:hypothetical protein
VYIAVVFIYSEEVENEKQNHYRGDFIDFPRMLHRRRTGQFKRDQGGGTLP